MMNSLADLKTIALTALFNPLFLGLLLVLFFAGKFFGKLTKRLNIWKILLLAYFGLFLYGPVRDAGPILGGIFLLGMASNHTRLIFSVFGWAQNLGDVIYAFRYRKAFEDIRRREQEQESRAGEERKRAYAEYDRQSQQQRGWKDEAEQHRQEAGKADGDLGSGQEGSARTGRGDKSGSQRQRAGRQKERPQQQPAKNTTRDRHLQTLGLKPGREYTAAEIKKAYRKAVMKAHPDAGGSQAIFVAVVSAWEWFK